MVGLLDGAYKRHVEVRDVPPMDARVPVDVEVVRRPPLCFRDHLRMVVAGPNRERGEPVRVTGPEGVLELTFAVSFIGAIALQLVVVVAACVQARAAWRAGEQPERPVITLADAAAGIVVFCGPALLLGGALHGWSADTVTDVLVYGGTFGIVGGALAQWARRRGAAPTWALAVPAGAGVLAGLTML